MAHSWSVGFGPGEKNIPGGFGHFEDYLVHGHPYRSISVRPIQVEFAVWREEDLACFPDSLHSPGIELLSEDGPAVVFFG